MFMDCCDVVDIDTDTVARERYCRQEREFQDQTLTGRFNCTNSFTLLYANNLYCPCERDRQKFWPSRVF
jgi:hypothetical protein